MKERNFLSAERICDDIQPDLIAQIYVLSSTTAFSTRTFAQENCLTVRFLLNVIMYLEANKSYSS